MVQVPSQSAGAATRIRYVVLALLAVLSMITYLDRVSFSAAQSHVIQELGLRSEADLKYAFMAFILAYSLFELPSSWWGDVFGPRRVLVRIVLWWSFFTAAIGTIGLRVGHGMVGAFTIGSVTIPALWTLVAVQFLFGLGEAGAYPNITRALHNWFPFQERGRAQGVVWMSARLMGGLTPLVWAILVEGINWVQVGPFLHWRTAFWTFGALGIVWCVIFALWFRNRPEEKPSVNAAELELIRQAAAEFAGGTRPRTVGPPGAERESVDAVHHVFLPILRLVVLHYVHAAVSRATARSPADGILGGRVQGRPALDGRDRLLGRRVPHGLVHPADG